MTAPAPPADRETVLVLDFGAQHGQLIARRVRELQVFSELLPYDGPLEQVRQVDRELRLSERLLERHPSPGPGLAVRLLGEVTEERLAILRQVDYVFVGALRRTTGPDGQSLYAATVQAFAVNQVPGVNRVTYDISSKPPATIDWE